MTLNDPAAKTAGLLEGTNGGNVWFAGASKLAPQPLPLSQRERGAPPGALEEPGVSELVLEPGRITGLMAGLGGFHWLRAKGIDRLPMLVIDGQTYAPGTSGDQLIIPLLPGSHSFEIRPLERPPIFRNWQAWDEMPQADHR